MEQQRVNVEDDSLCRFNSFLGCTDRSKCAACGWNPNGDIRKRRVETALRDRDKLIRAGKVHL